MDFLVDVRDLTYDITHFERTPQHLVQTIGDIVAFLLVIGAFKYGDEDAEVAGAVTKHGDEAADLVGEATKHADEVADVIKSGNKAILSIL